jgi:hypothetical protein
VAKVLEPVALHDGPGESSITVTLENPKIIVRFIEL